MRTCRHCLSQHTTEQHEDSWPEYERRAKADAQALADVRTLDGWLTAARERKAWLNHYGAVGAHPGWSLQVIPDIGPGQMFFGATPNEARAKAAAWVREQKP